MISTLYPLNPYSRPHVTLSPIRHPRFERALDELTSASDRVWLLALSTGLIFTLIAAYPFAGSRPRVFWAHAGLLIRGGL
jgi:hypothetical protein